jgi:hypothetical protein
VNDQTIHQAYAEAMAARDELRKTLAFYDRKIGILQRLIANESREQMRREGLPRTRIEMLKQRAEDRRNARFAETS